MRIRDMYQGVSCGVSIEIFPPKTAEGDESLIRALERLVPYDPVFISCTYGAGGTTRTRTIDWCTTIQSRFGIPATAHFTCLGGSVQEIEEWLDLATKGKIRNIMALRGDPPAGETTFRPAPGGLRYANELVALIRRRHPEMGIGVAGYPEKHQECPDSRTDLENLKRKVDAGADAVFTQLFYCNDAFFDFRDRYHRLGIEVPLIPGIMPITEFSRIKRITSMCGATIPKDLGTRLEAAQDDPEAQFEIGVRHAVRQCHELLRAGVPGIHFYVLNRSKACETILDELGLSPTREFNLS
ncbi:MAG TPA: methylenetetrahydrofolate reductase [NAD(P)H] [Planctomycetaceae bacterium]|nr:methylenetetrahydrofolate reductase [NAD(P)H] [Planctomycetaceae bacterium]